MSKNALIIGAGPAGLTAALELARRSDITPVVLEKSGQLGGLARTVNYKGNRIDIGGHRFFSKSDRVMDWWLEILPIERGSGQETISYEGQSRTVSTSTAGPDEAEAGIMLIRQRKSRIYFLRKFFDYPLKLSADTLRKLGLWRTLRIGLSYIASRLRPIKNEQSLEDFFINRFGRELYRTFFKSYTEKVWGVPCDRISAEWGAQRIKGLDVVKILKDAFRKLFSRGRDAGIRQKQTETSLIEKFLYPKYGPGQMWETVAGLVSQKGGGILQGWNVDRLELDGNRIAAAWATHEETGERRRFAADYFFSTMPVKELIEAMGAEAPANVREVSQGLVYRDFITVGLLLESLKISRKSARGARLLEDNWIYIQEPEVLVGRMQIFNNWSPYMVAAPDKVWIGLEYFCYDTDDLWNKSDRDLVALGTEEMQRIGMIEARDVLDATVIRMPKTYPAYFGSYSRFQEIRDYCDRFENLFLIGRNGMHRYNNQDHSMLAAMTAVDNILAGSTEKSNIWDVNTETEYHESK
jgi:protoporphyrinogen oxidase